MTHFLSDTVMDLGLNHLKNNVSKLILCNGAPANYGDAVTNYDGVGSGKRIAEVGVAPADFTVADDATSGRKVTSAEKAAIPVLAAGDGTHVAWVDVANTALLKVVPVPAPLVGLTTSATVTIPAHYHVFRDATAV